MTKLPAIRASTELQVGLLSVLHQWKLWAFYTRIQRLLSIQEKGRIYGWKTGRCRLKCLHGKSHLPRADIWLANGAFCESRQGNLNRRETGTPMASWRTRLVKSGAFSFYSIYSLLDLFNIKRRIGCCARILCCSSDWKCSKSAALFSSARFAAAWSWSGKSHLTSSLVTIFQSVFTTMT